eukprot:COSAG06_NODE_15326_length_1080_cov_0.995923_1_plen_190_part_10
MRAAAAGAGPVPGSCIVTADWSSDRWDAGTCRHRVDAAATVGARRRCGLLPALLSRAEPRPARDRASCIAGQIDAELFRWKRAAQCAGSGPGATRSPTLPAGSQVFACTVGRCGRGACGLVTSRSSSAASAPVCPRRANLCRPRPTPSRKARAARWESGGQWRRLAPQEPASSSSQLQHDAPMSADPRHW